MTENLTMNSSLTVYGVSKHLSVDHPVRHVEDVSRQAPRRLLVGVKDGLAGNAETHQHHQHDDHKVQHIDHLQEMSALMTTQRFLARPAYDTSGTQEERLFS